MIAWRTMLIRKLDEDVVELWRERAKASGRSLEAEVRKVLTDTVKFDWNAVWELRDRIGPGLGDSTELIRDDRDR